MNEKLFDSGLSLHEKIAKGIDTLANNVATTYGPRGRNVIIHGNGCNPIITKDGVTVAILSRRPPKQRLMLAMAPPLLQSLQEKCSGMRASI